MIFVPNYYDKIGLIAIIYFLIPYQRTILTITGFETSMIFGLGQPAVCLILFQPKTIRKKRVAVNTIAAPDAMLQ